MVFSVRSGSCLRCWIVLLVGVLLIYVSGPSLFLSFKKGLSSAKRAADCPPCVCDCPPSESILKITPALLNLSVADCGKDDPDLSEEMEKQYVDLVSEELKLHEVVAQESKHHMNLTFIEAKRVATEYQKEAEKCIAATETCEEARERFEAARILQLKLATMWEKRARRMGWEGE